MPARLGIATRSIERGLGRDAESSSRLIYPGQSPSEVHIAPELVKVGVSQDHGKTVRCLLEGIDRLPIVTPR
ncbi:hypothetical protein J7337_003667 [Fusarium musae]|uniref:Uncharacterized protein n=1 Tax=Fusarium musae TaxID=1042133 RepID=A0A9P8DKS4_9HYPO|nr:hypothetical protein J7337_003667 [Fusarium musae]KAG9503714.1 hypothetical protein J7337_003667 [Fusarium musae]